MNDLNSMMNVGNLHLDWIREKARTAYLPGFFFEQDDHVGLMGNFYFSCNPTLFPSQSRNTAK